MRTLMLSFLCSLWLSNIQAQIDRVTTIVGHCQPLAGQTVYLMHYDHASYASDAYLLDSVRVSDRGNFVFELVVEIPRLVIITDYNGLPPSYSVFREAPELYTFGFCARFLALYPTLLVAPARHYTVESWLPDQGENGIVFADRANNLLRQFYLGHDYLRYLSDQDSLFALAPDAAWTTIARQRDEWLHKATLHEGATPITTSTYYATEVKLGAVNNYLLWLDHQPPAVRTPGAYADALQAYRQPEWHPASLELLKLTERYLTVRMNEEKGEAAGYYPADAEKVAFAKQYAHPVIREKYVANLLDLSKTD